MKVKKINQAHTQMVEHAIFEALNSISKVEDNPSFQLIAGD